jgi:hypothetical protein
MMFESGLGRLAICSTTAAIFMLSSPAFARRDIIVDEYTYPLTVCSIGSACAGTTFSPRPFYSKNGPERAYVYRQGIISFEELPTNGNDFLGGDYNLITPGYSPDADYDVSGTISEGGGMTFNFLQAGKLMFQIGFFEMYVNGSDENETRFTILHSGGDPLAGAKVGYNLLGGRKLLNTDNIDFAASTFEGIIWVGPYGEVYEVPVSAFDTFNIVRGVPEPSTWAMLLMGFGLIGVATRAQGRRKTLAA